MKEKWLALKGRFESFEVRERCLMVGAAVAVIYLLWDFILLQPLGAEMKIMQARERVARQAIQTGEAELKVLATIAQKDPNLELKRNLQELQAQLQQLNGELETLATGLVAAEKLPTLLHQVLRQAGQVSVTRVTTLPPQEVLVNGDTAAGDPAAGAPTAGTSAAGTSAAGSPAAGTPAAALEVQGSTAVAQTAAAAQSAKLYKHGVELHMLGDFVGAVRYLQALEQSNWRFYWESLRYDVTDYPNAQIRLRVFTLSSQRGILDGR